MTAEVAADLADTQTDRREWLAARRKGIGSSDIAGIMGVSPYTTPFQVWASKVDDLAPDDEGTEAMQWGRLLEATIARRWCDVYGWEIQAEQRLVETTCTAEATALGLEPTWVDGDLSVVVIPAVATPDALITREDQESVLEVKTTHEWSWDEVPEHYVMQVQWQMLTTSRTRAVIAALHRGNRLETYVVERDQDLIQRMGEAAAVFWHQHVVPRVAPPVDPADNAFLASLWPDHTEQPVEVPADVADELRRARAAHAAAKTNRDMAEARIKALMENADTAVVDGQVAATWRTQTARRIDITRLRAEHPDIAAEYEKASSSRVFRIDAGWEGRDEG